MTTNSLVKRWGRHVMPRLYDPYFSLGERAGMAARRKQLVAATEGRVLELDAATVRKAAAT